MSFTPADIYNKKFKKTLRGYDTQEVDDYLDLIGVYYEEVISENDNLRLEVEGLKSQLEDYQEKEYAIEEKMNKAEEVVKTREVTAEKEAEFIIREAELKARDIIQNAKLESKKIEQAAQNKAEEKYKQYNKLSNVERLTKIRLKQFLESHLEMLEDDNVDLQAIKEELEFVEED
ncbi:DivIVA domain-containing protein [Orenia marismortui]|uniref:Cell division initiation protein n=1 Tax=Orenia marismortui TaxID=46469 RepID=A0A4V3GX41_9FIRM|nr:DivIVA domain-containing protein [Orenia marismortui]TDX46469.1 cell division initiation protein [Orenia marismortui]